MGLFDLESLLGHLTSLSPTSVYATIGAVLVLCGLGLPIPEDISLLAAGYMAHLGVVNVHKIFILCFVAVLGGDAVAFFLGRYFGTRILNSRLCRRLIRPKKQLRVKAYFRKYGSRMIFIGRFLPGLRASIFFSAGTMKLRPAVFFIWDTLAALLSVPALVYFAWAFGEHIDRVIAWARRSEYGILVVAAVVVGIFVLRAIRRRRKRLAATGCKSEDAPQSSAHSGV